MMLLIIVGWILTVMEPPVLIWVAYGFCWLAWIIRVIIDFAQWSKNQY